MQDHVTSIFRIRLNFGAVIERNHRAIRAADACIDARIVLTDENSLWVAKASNVWWYVGRSATINGGSVFKGNVLASATIAMGEIYG